VKSGGKEELGVVKRRVNDVEWPTKTKTSGSEEKKS